MQFLLISISDYLDIIKQIRYSIVFTLLISENAIFTVLFLALWEIISLYICSINININRENIFIFFYNDIVLND